MTALFDISSMLHTSGKINSVEEEVARGGSSSVNIPPQSIIGDVTDKITETASGLTDKISKATGISPMALLVISIIAFGSLLLVLIVLIVYSLDKKPKFS